jgi:hypothetical protein
LQVLAPSCDDRLNLVAFSTQAHSSSHKFDCLKKRSTRSPRKTNPDQLLANDRPWGICRLFTCHPSSICWFSLKPLSVSSCLEPCICGALTVSPRSP